MFDRIGAVRLGRSQPHTLYGVCQRGRRMKIQGEPLSRRLAFGTMGIFFFVIGAGAWHGNMVARALALFTLAALGALFLLVAVER